MRSTNYIIGEDSMHVVDNDFKESERAMHGERWVCIRCTLIRWILWRAIPDPIPIYFLIDRSCIVRLNPTAQNRVRKRVDGAWTHDCQPNQSISGQRAAYNALLRFDWLGNISSGARFKDKEYILGVREVVCATGAANWKCCSILPLPRSRKTPRVTAQKH